MKRLGIGLVLIVLVFLTTAHGDQVNLVDGNWLASHLDQKDIRIVDLRDDVKAYWTSHIPGAVYLSPDAMRWPQDGVPVKLIHVDALIILLGEMGIDRDTTIVAYSESGDYKAPYLIWALDYIGHEKSFILDGGFNKWVSEKRPITQDYPKIRRVKYGKPRINDDVRADVEDVRKSLSDNDVVVLDVRPIELYKGEIGPWMRKGHIKGALHRFWKDDLKDDGTWRSPEELKQTYLDLGITPDKTIIVSCGQGQMSAHTYFTLKHLLGYRNVMNYDGGFNEWSNLDELPVEIGSPPDPVSLSLDGEKLVAEKCVKCHNLKRVTAEKADLEKWTKIVDRMIKRGAELNDEEREGIIRYLAETYGE